MFGGYPLPSGLVAGKHCIGGKPFWCNRPGGKASIFTGIAILRVAFLLGAVSYGGLGRAICRFSTGDQCGENWPMTSKRTQAGGPFVCAVGLPQLYGGLWYPVDSPGFGVLHRIPVADDPSGSREWYHRMVSALREECQARSSAVCEEERSPSVSILALSAPWPCQH
ncbi:hypothetical protein EV126DRAFT_18272 [Verticillium dahliae]|nr:hypothetical protein EV126DRAFT_18272 [Verticillium dahliae]